MTHKARRFDREARHCTTLHPQENPSHQFCKLIAFFLLVGACLDRASASAQAWIIDVRGAPDGTLRVPAASWGNVSATFEFTEALNATISLQCTHQVVVQPRSIRVTDDMGKDFELHMQVLADMPGSVRCTWVVTSIASSLHYPARELQINFGVPGWSQSDRWVVSLCQLYMTHQP